MSNKIKFSDLRRLLVGVGFTQVSTPVAVLIGHRASDTLFVFRPCKSNDPVENHDLYNVRKMLEARGFMSAESLENQFKKTSA